MAEHLREGYHPDRSPARQAHPQSLPGQHEREIIPDEGDEKNDRTEKGPNTVAQNSSANQGYSWRVAPLQSPLPLLLDDAKITHKLLTTSTIPNLFLQKATCRKQKKKTKEWASPISLLIRFWEASIAKLPSLTNDQISYICSPLSGILLN